MIAANLSVVAKPAIHHEQTTVNRDGAIRGPGGQRAWKASTRNPGDPLGSESNGIWEQITIHRPEREVGGTSSSEEVG